MGLLDAFLGTIDNAKRGVKNSLTDFATDPRAFMQMRLAQAAEALPANPSQQSIMPGVNQVGMGTQSPGLLDWGMTTGLNTPVQVGLLGHTVYHGSPHKFDKFDASKIGTGEGAQAYGHGLYFAENPKVAKEYAINLANRDLANQGRLNAHANAKRLATLAGDPKYAADDIRSVLELNPEHEQ